MKTERRIFDGAVPVMLLLLLALAPVVNADEAQTLFDDGAGGGIAGV